MIHSIQKRSPFSLPKHSTFFKEDLFCKTLTILKPQLPVKHIINVTAVQEVQSYKLIETDIGRSYENQTLTGISLIVELSVREQIKYIAQTEEESIHSIAFEQFNSTDITLPVEYNGKRIQDIIASKGFSITPYIESLDINLVDPFHMQFVGLFLVDLTF